MESTSTHTVPTQRRSLSLSLSKADPRHGAGTEHRGTADFSDFPFAQSHACYRLLHLAASARIPSLKLSELGTPFTGNCIPKPCLPSWASSASRKLVVDENLKFKCEESA